ncbi:hypothetical protein A4A49_27942 [Nicotiana attenuata]|uniref:F-boxlrr-repeat protein n=1 Tax=Nicotiana attenuata TaxID=49451 RepID=A0A314L1Z5_NICAT|nr:hypothetical protein A4A49_27942 [Nicotiana attenuata]
MVTSVQTLLNNYPLIVTFIIERRYWLKKIELLNLQKIKTVSIRAKGHQRVKIQAPTLQHLLLFFMLQKILLTWILLNVNLKSLELSLVRISDGFLEHIISRFQSLESLTLHHVGLERKGSTLVGSRSLKDLKICSYTSIGEIDAPNLVSLEYVGYPIPELKIAEESSQLKHSNIELAIHNNLSAAFLCKLRKLLSNLTSWSQPFLYFYKCNEIK